MFFVYILQSQFDQSYYIGFTANLENRLKYHNEGKSRYTSKKIPWRIVYTEEFNTKKEALIRERFLKKQKSRRYIEDLIKEHN
jgi:putative endonuclease